MIWWLLCCLRVESKSCVSDCGLDGQVMIASPNLIGRRLCCSGPVIGWYETVPIRIVCYGDECLTMCLVGIGLWMFELSCWSFKLIMLNYVDKLGDHC